MVTSFFEQPILNSPYMAPLWRHQLDANGQPQGLPPVNSRRKSAEITPILTHKKRRPGQEDADAGLFETATTRDARGQGYAVHQLVNEIRGHLETWRALKNPADWRVTPATARLLAHWRSYNFQNQNLLLPDRGRRDADLADRGGQGRSPASRRLPPGSVPWTQSAPTDLKNASVAHPREWMPCPSCPLWSGQPETRHFTSYKQATDHALRTGRKRPYCRSSRRMAALGKAFA